MILFINSKNEIKDVNETSDENLRAIEVDDESTPFANWSVAKICCHKVMLNEEGKYTGFTPYVDTRIIEHIERLGLGNEQNATDITDAQLGIMETYEKTELNTEEITNIQLAIMELYEATAE